MIRLDVSDRTVVVWCTACHWRTLRGSRSEAYTVGSYHARTQHADDQRGVRTASELARRHRTR
jgi:hypothetical protein